MFPVVFIGFLLALGGGVFVKKNPVLFGRSILPKQNNNSFDVFTSHPILEAILQSHHDDELENDLVPYQSHCLRVLSLAKYFCSKEGTPATDRMIDLMAVALAYHDIDLWMAHGHMNYLQPSAAKAMEELKMDGKQEQFRIEPALTDTELDVINEIILQHHKLTPWKSAKYPNFDAKDTVMVNAVRKGDWADFTYGLIRFGLPSEFLQKALQMLPESGFHDILMGMGKRLSPNSIPGQMDVLKIFKW